MDLVIEKLSTLESVWRISSKEIVEVIDNDQIENEEFDIFKFKPLETKRITALIDELITAADEERKQFQGELKANLFKIEEEIKELGVPFVLRPLNPHLNLPRQLKISQDILDEFRELRAFIVTEKDKLYKEAIEMYKEELESCGNDKVWESEDQLPNWIHEIFNSNELLQESFNEESSFTTTAMSHLDAAIEKLDPFVPSLAGSLERLQDAHHILKGRLAKFQAEFEVLWKELAITWKKLSPFNSEELGKESKIVLDTLGELDDISCVQNTPLTPVIITRTTLKKVLMECKRIEKERSESISGSILLIGRLWNLLGTPELERFPLCSSDLSLNNMKLLSDERNRLINFQQQKFKELYDSQVIELRKLMTALRWNESKQQSVLCNCQSYTADGLQHLSRQIAALQPKLDSSLQIISLITSRYALIAKMREFEKSASDPARLFRSSFQLLQEEKFRKSALPSLLNLESQLKLQLNEYKAKFEEDFVYFADESGHEVDERQYIAVLEDEISGRFMSAGIFGFDQSKQRKERQSSVNSDTPRYTTTPSNNTSTSTNTNNRKLPTIGVIPQRRKLNK